MVDCRQLIWPRDLSWRGALLAFVDDHSLQQLVGETLAASNLNPAVRMLLLDTIIRSELLKLPTSWVTALEQLLNHKHDAIRREALAAVDRYPEPFVSTLYALPTIPPSTMRFAPVR